MAFWQILNQTFNAVVNFSNRSGSTDARNSQILAAYAAAVSSSCTVIYRLRLWSDNVVGLCEPNHIALSFSYFLQSVLKIFIKHDSATQFSKSRSFGTRYLLYCICLLNLAVKNLA